MDTLAPYCEITPRMPPAKDERMTIPNLFDLLEKSETKAQALDACFKMLSSHGLMSDIDSREGLWQKLEKLRGR